MKAKRRAVFRRIGLVVLGLLLGFNVYLLNAKHVAGNPMPMPFGVGAAVVQSGSMEPTYETGDLLFVREKSAYAVGDVVVYQSGASLVVHRIIAMDETTVTTQGDANNTPDAPFDAAQIKGAVIGRIPGVGYAIDFLKRPLGVSMLAVCAVALVELSFRRDKGAAEQDETALRNQRLREEIERMRRELDEMDRGGDET